MAKGMFVNYQMAEADLEEFIDELFEKVLNELQEQYQICFPKEAVSEMKNKLISLQMSKEQISEYVEKKKKEIISRTETERKVKSGERQSNFDEIINTVGILFSDENLSSKLSIYGGTIPYLMTGEQPQRIIGDIDTHVSMQDMQFVRKIIANNPEKYKIISDTLQATGKEYGFEMLVDGITVSVFPTIEDERGMVINNFHENELENSMKLVSTIFYGVDEKEEIEVIDVNGIPVRIMSPEFTYITKGVAGRPKDIEDRKVLEQVIRPEKLEQMEIDMKTPERLAVEVVHLGADREIEKEENTNELRSEEPAYQVTVKDLAIATKGVKYKAVKEVGKKFRIKNHDIGGR